MKTLQLPEVGGTLTISANFNFLELVGAERDLVTRIVDMMNEFDHKNRTASG
jgi:hypothetical protein